MKKKTPLPRACSSWWEPGFLRPQAVVFPFSFSTHWPVLLGLWFSWSQVADIMPKWPSSFCFRVTDTSPNPTQTKAGLSKPRQNGWLGEWLKGRNGFLIQRMSGSSFLWPLLGCRILFGSNAFLCNYKSYSCRKVFLSERMLCVSMDWSVRWF